MYKIIFPIFATILTIFYSDLAIACSCEPLTLDMKFKNAESVYLAKLVSYETVFGNPDGVGVMRRDHIEAKFKIDTIYSGNPSQYENLVTGMNKENCGVTMVKRRNYLIFESKDNYISICDGSRLLEKDFRKNFDNLLIEQDWFRALNRPSW